MCAIVELWLSWEQYGFCQNHLSRIFKATVHISVYLKKSSTRGFIVVSVISYLSLRFGVNYDDDWMAWRTVRVISRTFSSSRRLATNWRLTGMPCTSSGWSVMPMHEIFLLRLHRTQVLHLWGQTILILHQTHPRLPTLGASALTLGGLKGFSRTNAVRRLIKDSLGRSSK